MKKVLLILSALVMVCSVAAADFDLSTMSRSDLISLQSQIDAALKALDSSDSGSNDLGIWEFQYYIDEFKMPTDKAYIRNTDRIIGTFSNSATDNSRLDVRFLVDKNRLTIMLYEYGRNLVKNSYSSRDEDYYVCVLDPNGIKHEFFGYIPPDGDRLCIEKDAFGIRENEADLINILKQGGKIHFYVEESGRSITNYNFVIEDATGFAAAYEQLLSK